MPIRFCLNLCIILLSLLLVECQCRNYTVTQRQPNRPNANNHPTRTEKPGYGKRNQDTRQYKDIAALQVLHPQLYATISKLRAGQPVSDINATNEQGQTLLHQAVSHPSIDPDIVQELLDAGADPNVADSSGRTPLSIAASLGNQEVFEALLQAGAHLDIAAKPGHGRRKQGTKQYEDIATLQTTHPQLYATISKLRAGQPVSDINATNEQGQTLLHQAVSHPSIDPDIVQKLLDAGADPNVADSSGCTPLSIAASLGNQEVFEALLQAGAHLDIAAKPGGNTLLTWAALGNNEKIVELLLKRGADVNSKGNLGTTPLRAAVFRRDNPDNPAVVELLLQAGADPEAEDKFAATPLFWAVTFNKLENIKLLLAAGASIDVVNDLGLTLWETAAANNVSGAIIAALNAHQAKLNAAGQQERAPLTQAVLSRDSNKLKALLEQGANPNAIERNGWTPLHLAVLRKEQKLVDLLLAYGANPSLKIKGRTALHYAMQQLVIRSQLSKS